MPFTFSIWVKGDDVLVQVLMREVLWVVSVFSHYLVHYNHCLSFFSVFEFTITKFSTLDISQRALIRLALHDPHLIAEYRP